MVLLTLTLIFTVMLTLTLTLTLSINPNSNPNPLSVRSSGLQFLFYHRPWANCLINSLQTVTMEEEFQCVQRLSAANKLQINVSKTKELIFRRPSAHHFTAPQPLLLIEQVNLLEFMFLQHYPMSHMSSISLLLPVSECTYLHSSRIGGCVLLYMLYLLSLSCPLFTVLFHHLWGSCQKDL